MTSPNAPEEDPMKDMHPVKRTIVRNAVNVAQPGDLLHKSAVENLGLKVGDDDEADVLPVGSQAPEVTFVEPEVRYDKPVVPPAGPLGTTAGSSVLIPTVEPAKDDEKKTPRRSSAKDE